jgi:serine/threonine protein kinase
VFDCGVDNGTAFIVMELVPGRTLRQVLDEQRMLAFSEAVRIAVAVCEALEVAHAAGLVHRDIKPANIMISDSEVKVLDFGIARAEGTAGATQTQAVLGTAAYLSPEQASGGQAGPRSDLYSLGCVLFEMLTGMAPFTADSAVGLAYRHVHDDPGPPSARRPEVPPQLDWITVELLAKDPSARPPSAAAARAALITVLRSDGTAVLPMGLAEQFGQGPSRRARRSLTRTEMTLATALVVALVALVAVLVSGGKDKVAPPQRPAVTTHSPSTTARPSPPPAHKASTLTPKAAAAATFVGDLEAGVADGQVAPQAGQDLYSHLQQLLFGPPSQNAQQIERQYGQLVQAYDHHRSQGQITGHAAAALHHALKVLGTAFGA